MGYGISHIVLRRGYAQRLPYPDANFDAAYLVSVLGEIPDAKAALHEIRRVLKPGARLLICEVLLDPDCVSLPVLRALATDAGSFFERTAGFRCV